MNTGSSDGGVAGTLCPECGGVAVPIIYGLPTAEDFNDPTFYSGGCIIMPDQPNWACPDCEIEFA